MVRDHGTLECMETVPISKFKATCLARLEKVRQTGRPLLITKRGTAVAQVIPPPPPDAPRSGFGVMAGTAQVHGDLVAPLDEVDWEALR
jgi:prevent-host-death family protein